MAQIKINQYVRDQVFNEIVKDAFNEKLKELYDRARAVDQKTLAKMYSPELIAKAKELDELLKSMKTCDSRYSEKTAVQKDYIQYRISGQYITMRYLGSAQVTHHRCGLTAGWIAENLYNGFVECILSYDTFTCTSEDEIGAEVLKIIDDDKALQAEIVTRASTLEATLKKFRTLEQVEKHWPEALPIFEKYVDQKKAEPKTEIAVMSFDELNEFFKLPPEKVEPEPIAA